MDVVKNIFLFFSCIILCCSSVLAHNPEISTTVIANNGDQNWIVKVTTALTALEHEINVKYGEDAFNSPEEFNELVIKHLLDEIELLVNNKKVTLVNGMVNLGHETSVTFFTDKFPLVIKEIEFTNSAFSNIYKNRGVLFFLIEGFAKAKFDLRNKNNHQVKLKGVNGTFTLDSNLEEEEEEEEETIFYIIIGIISMLILLLLVKLSKNKEPL